MVLSLIYKEAAFTFTQIYKKYKTTAFWMLIQKLNALENPTRVQAGVLTWARRLNSKNPITYSWRYVSVTKLAFPWFPLQIK